MFYLANSETDLLVGKDGKTMVDSVTDADSFPTFGEASEASQNYGPEINVVSYGFGG